LGAIATVLGAIAALGVDQHIEFDFAPEILFPDAKGGMQNCQEFIVVGLQDGQAIFGAWADPGKSGVGQVIPCSDSLSSDHNFRSPQQGLGKASFSGYAVEVEV
jgi:hypothetical protein